MPFDLAIAVKRDASASADVERVTASSKTLVFDATGTLSREGAAALAQAIDGAISPDFQGYVVRFHTIEDVDNEALLTFAQWVRGRREEGLDIRLCALEPHMHMRLEELDEVPTALMPLAHAAEDTPRRMVDVHRDVLGRETVFPEDFRFTEHCSPINSRKFR
jgi:hypothetical protein